MIFEEESLFTGKMEEMLRLVPRRKQEKNLGNLELAKDYLNGTHTHTKKKPTNYRTKYDKFNLITIKTISFTKET